MPHFTAERSLECGHGMYGINSADSLRGQLVIPQFALTSLDVPQLPNRWARFVACSTEKYAEDIKVTPDGKVHILWRCDLKCGTTTLDSQLCGETIL